MPRSARLAAGGLCYHVINRGNARATVFLGVADYQDFIGLMSKSCERLPMRVLSYCVMPNHVHLVLWPQGDGDLSRWMAWLMTAHVRRHHKRHSSDGHLWQGRFKSFPIQQDEHLFTVMRYVERNPLRAGLVERAEDWRWSSLHSRLVRGDGSLLHPPPFALPNDWRNRVNRAETAAELAALRHSVNRGKPWGAEPWVVRTARALGLESTLRGRGRPLKQRG